MRFPSEFKKHQRIIHFLWWDADLDLAQATWEWPKRRPHALEVLAAKGCDWNHDFNDRLFHDDSLWRSIQESKGV